MAVHSGGIARDVGCRKGERVTLQVIPPVLADEAWMRGACDLSKALERDKDGTTPADMLGYLRSGKWLLIHTDKGAWAAAEVQELPLGKVFHIAAAYGPGECTRETMDDLTTMARTAGCKYIQCGAWGAAERLYKRLGFEPAYSVMRAEL